MGHSHNIDIDINLADANRSSRNIGLDWGINIPPRKKGFLERLFSTGPDKIEKDIELKLDGPSVPKELVTNGPLITLVKDGASYNQDVFPVSLTLDSLNTTFNVFINEQNIIDYTVAHGPQATRVPVKFTLSCTDKATNEPIDQVTVELTLVLSRIEAEPEIDFLVNPEIQFDSTKKEEHLGYITIKSSAQLKYAAPVRVVGKVHATLNQIDASQLIQIRLKQGDEMVNIADIDTPYLSKGQEITYDLYLKMSEMRNPLTECDKLDVKFMGSYYVGKNSIDTKHLNVLTETCDIKQDTQGSEVHGRCGDRAFDNGTTIKMDEHSFFALSPLMKEIRLTFFNIAKDQTNVLAGVKIFNLGISATLPSGVKVYDNNGKLIDVNSSGIFSIDCPSRREILTDEGIFIPNGISRDGGYNSVDVLLKFSPKKISAIRGAIDYHFTAEIRVTFDYYENKHGLDDEKLMAQTPSKYSAVIHLPLYLQPNSEWLCVDYGSSAIVCLYNQEIIDLRERKVEIMKKAIVNDDLRKDNFEAGSKFLSSDIIFHATAESEVSSLATEQEGDEEKQYNDLAVFLSPTSSMYVNETLRLLPCLKLLVGNEVLPKNKYLYPHQYNRRTRDGRILRVTLAQDVDHETSLMKIDQVFRQSYEALFRYYISKKVPDRNSIHRLVLTYPNTYTPRHIATLRQVVKAAFPSLRVLEFVSESDAVASYYLSHWFEYNDSNANIYDNENILVFDMGAGTLDISYIDKSQEANNNLSMRILGKLGTSKAGNYLDFVLAQIVAQITGLPLSLATTDAPIDEEESADRTKLKLFVKTQVKPILNDANAMQKLKYNEFDFTVGDVLNHPLFTDFLSACTRTILTRLVNYMNSFTGRLKIDTVLLSGRSCLLEPLQKKLKEAISEISDYQPRFVVLDKPLRSADPNTDTGRQKTAVALGAMEMADNYRRPGSTINVVSNRHYASFGVVYEKLGGMREYCEILNHKDIPEAANYDQFDSKSIVIKGLNTSRTLTLVQTYLSAEDTQKAINQGDYELVTEMEIINTQALGRPNEVEVKLRINEFNDIILCFGKQSLVTEGHQPKGEDLQSEETKRSIWPVTI